MKLPKEYILPIFAQNIVKRRSVLPIPVRSTVEWTEGLKIKRGGETVLYTGSMYQLIPYAKAVTKRMESMKLPETEYTEKVLPFGKYVNSLLNVTPFMFLGMVSEQERRYFNGCLRNVARLLMSVGVDFGYLYEDDMYAGALAYDQGLDIAFEKHAKRVFKRLKNLGVKQIITVDPHTTEVFLHAYKKFIPDFDIEVKSYIQVLAEANFKGVSDLKVKLVIHDSCVYARYLGIIDEPRKILQNVKVKIAEPKLSGEQTHCCGGPIESLFPEKACEIARNRVDDLASLGRFCVTMCPVCLMNLRQAAIPGFEINDMSYYLALTLQ